MIKKLTDREHILHRPSMYIGGVDETEIYDFIIDESSQKVEYKSIKVVPGLIKIINEIIDNSIDVAIKTDFKFSDIIKINISETEITVSDNGTGIPIKKSDGIYTPHLCWGFARAGSNFDENTGQIGTNGVGSFATNVFSLKFTGITDDGDNHYKITFTDNASNFKESVSKSKQQGTSVSFIPDLEKFKLQIITKDHIDFIYQRILNLSICFPKINFYFNNKKVNTKNFKSYVKLFDENSEIYEEDHIKIAILPNDTDDFKHFSYVNGLKMPDGGIHIDLISQNICNIIRDKLSKKYKSIKPGDIKNKLTLLCFMTGFPSPKFNSQSKEKLTNSIKEFNDFANIDYSFVNKVFKNDSILEPIVEIYKIKEAYKEKQELKNALKTPKKLKLEKYYPATKIDKYICLVEGDSACGSLQVVLGNDDTAYYALKGKPLNAYDKSQKDFVKNEELKGLLNVLLENTNFIELPDSEQIKVRINNQEFYCDKNDEVEIDGIWVDCINFKI